MHPYAINLEERRNAPLLIAGVAFGFGWLISHVISAYSLGLPFWIEVPSVAGLYGAGYELLKHRLWKWSALRAAGMIKTPGLAGEWVGHVTSSFDKHAAQHAVTVTISQNWTELCVRLRAGHSQSQSVIGSITVDDETTLTYEYENAPLPGASATMHAHRGTARLRVCNEEQVLEGEYYSGRDRENQGMIRLEKVL